MGRMGKGGRGEEGRYGPRRAPQPVNGKTPGGEPRGRRPAPRHPPTLREEEHDEAARPVGEAKPAHPAKNQPQHHHPKVEVAVRQQQRWKPAKLVPVGQQSDAVWFALQRKYQWAHNHALKDQVGGQAGVPGCAWCRLVLKHGGMGLER